MRTTAPERDGAIGQGAIDEAPHALEVLGRDQRADARPRLARIADDHRRRRLPHLREKRLRDRGLDQDARTGEAHLPGVQVLHGDRLSSGVEVGVGTDDERRLPAELDAHRNEVPRTGHTDETPRFR